MRKLTLALLPFLALSLPAQTSRAPRPKAAGKLLPLTPRERAVQLLDRFTFGPRPGDVERILAQGPDAWFDQQLTPDTIPDSALAKRLAEFSTLAMTPEQALTLFPDRGAIQRVAEGKSPYPADPLLADEYLVAVTRYNEDLQNKKVDATGRQAPQPTEAESAARKKVDQATAARIAGDLFILPRNQRMPALIKLPVEDQIAFTTYLAGDQKNLLYGDMTPREREVFNAMQAGNGSAYQIVNELSQAKMLRAILSERQLQEVMTDFWFNHFNIYIGKDSDQWYTTSYERDVIRKHALGKFRDLLLATAQSPAMMVYLDNYLSIGPNSIANGGNNRNGKRGARGLNENYGREVMELHTVGVNGGYTQSDVTQLAAILTGWTVDRPNQGGPFQFDSKRHEPGLKQWFGHTLGTAATQSGTPASPLAGQAPDPGMKEGIEALGFLAASPQTAHFISWKLAQRFVADEPPAPLVDRMAATYLSTDGDIKAVLRTLVQSPEFNSRKYFRNKVKTPVEFLASAFRTTATDPQNPGALVNTLKSMGMPLYYALPPTGYYITADQWMNTGALVGRLNFAYALTSSRFANQKFDSSRVLALGLLSQPAAIRPVASPAPNSAVPARRIRSAGAGQGSATLVNVAAPSSADTPLELPVTGAGADIALHVLESTLVGTSLSAQTTDLIHQQLAQQTPAATPTDTLNLLTALVMGSPDFQLR